MACRLVAIVLCAAKVTSKTSPMACSLTISTASLIVSHTSRSFGGMLEAALPEPTFFVRYGKKFFLPTAWYTFSKFEVKSYGVCGMGGEVAAGFDGELIGRDEVDFAAVDFPVDFDGVAEVCLGVLGVGLRTSGAVEVEDAESAAGGAVFGASTFAASTALVSVFTASES